MDFQSEGMTRNMNLLTFLLQSLKVEPCDFLGKNHSGTGALQSMLTRQHANMRRSCKRSRKKWKRSDSSDSDCVVLMTPLTTPIFYFHQVQSNLTTLLTTPTPTPALSLVKTSLYRYIAVGEANGKSSTFTINNSNNRLHKQIVWAPWDISGQVYL